MKKEGMGICVETQRDRATDPCENRTPTKMSALVLDGASLRASATATRAPQKGSDPMCFLWCACGGGGDG